MTQAEEKGDDIAEGVEVEACSVTNEESINDIIEQSASDVLLSEDNKAVDNDDDASVKIVKRPKKARTAYFIFQDEHRAKVMADVSQYPAVLFDIDVIMSF